MAMSEDYQEFSDELARRGAQRAERKPVSAVVEIIDSRQGDAPDGVIVPEDVRINGQSVLTSADHPVKVHEIEVPAEDLVCVTLTLIARRVVIGGGGE